MASLTNAQQFIEQVQAILSQRFDPDDFRSAGSMIARARAAIERIAGRHSPYSEQLEAFLVSKNYYEPDKVRLAVGVLEALKTDLEAGYLASFEELIHGEVFGDYLEMADHLHAQGYKDAAAVIAGSTLEAHLRQLCSKAGVDTLMPDGQPKKAELMNADLVKADAYSRQNGKDVTAWLGLRNLAAHGKYDDYTAGEVGLLIAGVRDFITRHPA